MRSINELIRLMLAKRNNIKLHLTADVFQDVVERLEELDHCNSRLYAEMRENYELKQRLGRIENEQQKTNRICFDLSKRN